MSEVGTRRECPVRRADTESAEHDRAAPIRRLGVDVVGRLGVIRRQRTLPSTGEGPGLSPVAIGPKCSVGGSRHARVTSAHHPAARGILHRRFQDALSSGPGASSRTRGELSDPRRPGSGTSSSTATPPLAIRPRDGEVCRQVPVKRTQGSGCGASAPACACGWRPGKSRLPKFDKCPRTPVRWRSRLPDRRGSGSRPRCGCTARVHSPKRSRR